MIKTVLIFPCYNEEEVLKITKNTVVQKLNELIQNNVISNESKICFVDDGSKDHTWSIIEGFDEDLVTGIKLSKNYGHQYALLAGLELLKNKFDAYVTMDVDLQDDINSIEEMINEYKNGFDIVYGVRNDRRSDTFFKKTTAQLFYTFMQKLGVNTVYNHADYRLISNRALKDFLKFGETHLFLRGIFPLVGLKQSNVYYKRMPRTRGESKYPLRKMLAFAWEGITSFSIKPLKMVTAVGAIAIFVSVALSVWALVSLILGNVITGWTSLVILIIFFGGIQSVSLGIIGEYIGKIYMQVKNRPRYLVEKTINLTE